MATYADKPWLQHYDSGVPPSLEPYPDKPMHDFLRESAQRYASHPIMLTSAPLPVIGRLKSQVTYREVDVLSDALASALLDLGLQKGDRVALVMPNIVQFVVSFYAVLKAGGVVAAANPTYPPRRMAHQINDCGAKIAIVMSRFYPTVKQVQEQTQVEHIIVTNVKEYLPGLARILFTLLKERKSGDRVTIAEEDHDFQDLLKRHNGKRPDVQVQPDDLAIFQYTGGTTGIAKAAMATHKALVANCLMCQAWLRSPDVPGDEEIFLAAIPLFHVFGMVAVMGFAVSLGALMVLVPNARDIDDVLQNIHRYRPTIFMGVPALYNAINNRPEVVSGKYDITSVTKCISGSAPLAPATKRHFEELSGGVICEGFGMSEAPTATHVNPLRGENRTGSIGLPMPDMEMKIVNLEDGETEVPVGEPGELCMAGPQIMVGYYGMPTETSNVLRKDESGKVWLYTGDIARMDDDGYFYIVDRKKDMVLVGGHNVYPRVVEDVLAEHPAVLEVAVAGIPHPNPEKVGQEALKAWVVLKEGQALETEELIEFALEHLMHQEVPRRIDFVEALPRTEVGKILRRELIQQEMQAHEDQ